MNATATKTLQHTQPTQYDWVAKPSRSGVGTTVERHVKGEPGVGLAVVCKHVKDIETARLIASAPTMYEALQAAEDSICGRNGVDEMTVLNTIRAALAKAQGGGK